MIIIGPLAFLCLLCVLLLFFRPIRLLAGSVLLTVVVIALRYTGANSGEHIDLPATILVTQVIFWLLVAASGNSRRKRQAEQIAEAVAAGLARHGISEAPPAITLKPPPASIALVVAAAILVLIGIAWALFPPHVERNAAPAAAVEEPASIAPPQPDTPVPSPKPRRKHSNAPKAVPTSESRATVMPLADPSPGAEPPQ